MTAAAWAALAVAAALAATDWIAVARRATRVEYVAKPATMAALIVAALTLDPADPAARTWFVVALCFSLLGDVFLMVPGDRFVAGLASFLLAHLAYIAGFVAGGVGAAAVLVGAVVVAPVTTTVGRHIVGRLRAGGDRDLLAPVVAYMTVISVMVVVSFGDAVGAAGASLFFLSDALIAWNRFVTPWPTARVTIMVTYHLGQGLLVLSLT